MGETRFNRICQRFEDAGYVRGKSNSRRYVRYYNPDGGIREIREQFKKVVQKNV